MEKGHLDVNMTNFQQLTPLHVAVHKDHVECAKRLIAYGCDISVKAIMSRYLLAILFAL